uniref:C3H1-type domain-containing protein n=1 Tax=Globodera rostochiensis TaxID=31243 RepID=A0A914I0G0_GLORO
MKCIFWFSNMTNTEKRLFMATFVCLFAHLALAVLHIFPPIDAIFEHGIALALFQVLEALVNLSTIWAQIKQSTVLFNTNSSLLDGKHREIRELKSQLNRSKETNKMMNQSIIHLQQQLHLLTQKLDDEEKRANILTKNYGDTQKKLARAEVRLRHVQRTVQELEAENFELSNELEEWRNKKHSSVALDDGVEVWDNDEENKTDDEEEMRELDEEGDEQEKGEVRMELLQREIDNLLTDSGTYLSCSYNTLCSGKEYQQLNGTNGEYKKAEWDDSMAPSFDVFAGFSPFIKAFPSRSQSESKPMNSFAISTKAPTATNALYNYSHNGKEYQQLNGTNGEYKKAEWDESMTPSFDVFTGFSPFIKASLSRSQSESKPTNSFANIAAKPPTATNTLYNYNQQSRTITPQTPVMPKKIPPTSQNEHSQQKCSDKVDIDVMKAPGLQKELKKLDPFYFKTELCEFWNSDEPCPYGDGCNFAHGPDELRPMGVKGPKSVAKTPSFYNNRQRLRKTRTKTQTIQPLTSYGKPVEQKVTRQINRLAQITRSSTDQKKELGQQQQQHTNRIPKAATATVTQQQPLYTHPNAATATVTQQQPLYTHPNAATATVTQQQPLYTHPNAATATVTQQQPLYTHPNAATATVTQQQPLYTHPNAATATVTQQQPLYTHPNAATATYREHKMGNNHANAAVMTMSSGGDSRHGSSRGRGGQYHLSHPSSHHLLSKAVDASASVSVSASGWLTPPNGRVSRQEERREREEREEKEEKEEKRRE